MQTNNRHCSGWLVSWLAGRWADRQEDKILANFKVLNLLYIDQNA